MPRQSEDIEIIDQEPMTKKAAPEAESQAVPFAQTDDPDVTQAAASRGADLDFFDKITDPLGRIIEPFVFQPEDPFAGDVRIVPQGAMPDEDEDLRGSYHLWSGAKLDANGYIAEMDFQQREQQIKEMQTQVLNLLGGMSREELAAEIQAAAPGITISGRPVGSRMQPTAFEQLASLRDPAVQRQLTVGVGSGFLEFLEVPASALRYAILKAKGTAPEDMWKIVNLPTDEFMQGIGIDMEHITRNMDPRWAFWSTLAATLGVGIITDPLAFTGVGSTKTAIKETAKQTTKKGLREAAEKAPGEAATGAQQAVRRAPEAEAAQPEIVAPGAAPAVTATPPQTPGQFAPERLTTGHALQLEAPEGTLTATQLGEEATRASKITPEFEQQAQRYNAAPEFDPDAVPLWDNLISDVERRYDEIAQDIKIIPVNDDAPYKSAQEMIEDIQRNKQLKVSALHNEHPLWTPEQNLKFRAVHDFDGHFQSGADFTLQGEKRAFDSHAKTLQSDEARQALEVEVLGQAAAAVQSGKFQVQKVFVPGKVGAEVARGAEQLPGGAIAQLEQKMQTVANLTPEAARQLREDAVTASLQAFKDSGGAGSTVNLFDGNLLGQDVWAVSIFPEREVLIRGRNVTPDDIEKFIAQNQDLLADRRVSVGLWTDSDGVIHLEPSVTVQDRKAAEALGRQFDQKSIVNLRDPANTELQLGGSGKPDLSKLPPLEERLNLEAFRETEQFIGITGAFEEIELPATDALRAVQPGTKLVKNSAAFNQIAGIGASAIHHHGGRASMQTFKTDLAARLPAHVLEQMDSATLKSLYEKSQREYAKVVRKFAKGIPSQEEMTRMFHQGKYLQHWYDDFRHEADAIFSSETYTLPSGKVTSDAEMFTRFLAATSPRTKVEENVDRAIDAFTEWKSGKPFSNDFEAHRPNLERIAAGEPFGVDSLKVQSFFNNLWNDPQAVTVDSWMMQIFGMPAEKISAKPGTIRFVQETVRREAALAGVEPRQYQAAMWVAQKLVAGLEKGEVLEPLSATVKRKLQERIASNPDEFHNILAANNVLRGVRGESGAAKFPLILALSRSIAGALAGTVAAPDDSELEGALIGAGLGAFGPSVVKAAVKLLREQKGPAKPFFSTARGREVAAQARMERAMTQSQLSRMYQRELNEFVQGKRPRAQVREEADLLVDWGAINEDTIRAYFPGQTMNDATLVAVNRVMTTSAQHLQKLARQLDPSDKESVDEFLKHLYRHSKLDVRRLAVRAETGRALGVLDDIEGESKFLDQFSNLAGRLKLQQSPARIAELVQSYSTPEQVTTFARAAAKPGFSDMLIEVWINGLLSGPITAGVNFTGNAAFLLWNIGERGLSRIFGNNVAPGEGWAMMSAMIENFQDALAVGWRAFRDEDTMTSVLGKVEQRRKAITAENINSVPIMKKLGASVNEVGPVGAAIDWIGNAVSKVPVGPADEVGKFVSSFKQKGSVIRLPGRVLVGTDEFFKALAFRAELRALARREAFAEIRAQGLTGRAAKRELDTRMRHILTNPPEDIKQQAKAFAAYSTFTNELGPAGQALQQFTKASPAGRLIMPFVRTPTNIFKAGFLQRTPLGLVSKEFHAKLVKGGPEAQIAMAQLSFGSMTMAMATGWAAMGFITGAGPEDPDAQRELRATGWQPYSINVSKIMRTMSGADDEGINPRKGDKFISFSRIEPLAMVLGLGADFAAIGGQLERKERETLAGAVVVAVARNSASKTFVKGVAEAASAITKPDRYLENTTMRQVGTLMPFSQAISQTSRVLDPTIRDARTMMDAYRSRVWPFAKDVPCSRNLFAECGTYSPGLGPDIASPLYTTEAKPDPVVDAAIEDQVSMSLPSEYIGKLRLKPEEYERLQILVGKEIEIGGKTLHEKLAEVVQRARSEGRTIGRDSWRSGEMAAVINKFKRRGRRQLIRENEVLRNDLRKIADASREAGIAVPTPESLAIDDAIFEVE